MTAVEDATPPLEELFLIVYCLLDDLYHRLVPLSVQHRPGYRRLQLSDAEVLTLSLMQEALSIDSETAFIRFVRRNLPQLFPHLVERSRYHRRRKALLDVERMLFAHLASELCREAAYLVVDSAPVETTKVERSQTGGCRRPPRSRRRPMASVPPESSSSSAFACTWSSPTRARSASVPWRRPTKPNASLPA